MIQTSFFVGEGQMGFLTMLVDDSQVISVVHSRGHLTFHKGEAVFSS